jgi:hypothetical protein
MAGQPRGSNSFLAGFGLMGGALLMLASFVVPWWYITITPPSRNSNSYSRSLVNQMMEDNSKRLVKHVGWYMAHTSVLTMEDMSDIEDVAKKDMKWSRGIWGWQCGEGITSFILALGIFGISGLTMAIASVRRWGWMSALVAAAMGIAPLILAILWMVSSPSVDIGDLMQQGISAGPLLALPGAIIVIVVGIARGIPGLMKFARDIEAAITRTA